MLLSPFLSNIMKQHWRSSSERVGSTRLRSLENSYKSSSLSEDLSYLLKSSPRLILYFEIAYCSFLIAWFARYCTSTQVGVTAAAIGATTETLFYSTFTRGLFVGVSCELEKDSVFCLRGKQAHKHFQPVENELGQHKVLTHSPRQWKISRIGGILSDGDHNIVIGKPLCELLEGDSVIAIVIELIENILDFCSIERWVDALHELRELLDF